MAIEKLFLSHYSERAPEVAELATELRLRGVVPWVDKDGGFSVGDESEAEARRALREDCFGLLLYATPEVFRRPFIRDIELDEARLARRMDPRYILFAVPRGISFADLKRRSKREFRIDLSAFHTVPLCDDDLVESRRRVAREALRKVLQRAANTSSHLVSLQVSTREAFPDEPDDLLRVDAAPLFRHDIAIPSAWDRLLVGLRDLKAGLSSSLGRPRLRVHGSKHLTAAFMIGRVFAPFEMEIRQTAAAYWRTDTPAPERMPLTSLLRPECSGGGRLFVEVASGAKAITAGVDEFVASSGIHPTARLLLRPPSGPLNVDNAGCVAMAKQTYQAIDHAMSDLAASGNPIEEIHLFVAAPQAFMMMLGRAFKGMPATYLYEWSGTRYAFTCLIPAGVL